MVRVCRTLAWLALCVAPLAQAGEDATATRVAESWMGKDASELLTRWPVDASVNFTTFDQKDGGMGYAFVFIRAGYTTNDRVSDGSGVGPGGPIEYYHYERVDVPAAHQCSITFYADPRGVINNYSYQGSNCGPTIRAYRAKT